MHRYETHTHTAEVSRCSLISAAELVRGYKQLGFSGVWITDHFLNGNTTVPAHLPWEDRVREFCRGYYNAYREGRRIGIDVFFGWEYSYRGTDLLTYGLDPQWLMAHPEVMKLHINEYCDLVHAHGGFIAHAHPFREANYIDLIRLLPRKVDAVEVVNTCRTEFENKMARQYADNYGLLKIAGSDNHAGLMPRYDGVETVHKVNSGRELFNAVKEGKARLFTVSIA